MKKSKYSILMLSLSSSHLPAHAQGDSQGKSEIRMSQIAMPPSGEVIGAANLVENSDWKSDGDMQSDYAEDGLLKIITRQEVFTGLTGNLNPR